MHRIFFQSLKRVHFKENQVDTCYMENSLEKSVGHHCRKVKKKKSKIPSQRVEKLCVKFIKNMNEKAHLFLALLSASQSTSNQLRFKWFSHEYDGVIGRVVALITLFFLTTQFIYQHSSSQEYYVNFSEVAVAANAKWSAFYAF